MSILSGSPSRRLTYRESRFIDEFLACGNATLAAERAGYSKRTADAIGSEVRRKPYILAEIDRRLALLEPDTAERIRSHIKPEVRSRGRGYVYIVRADNGLVKIGRAQDLRARLERLNTQLPYDLVVLRLFEVEDPHTRERELHQRFGEKRIRGEWFRLTEADLAML